MWSCTGATPVESQAGFGVRPQFRQPIGVGSSRCGVISMKNEETIECNRVARRIGRANFQLNWRRFLGGLATACLFTTLLPLQASALASNEGDASDASAKAANSRSVRLSDVTGNVRLTQDGQLIADPAVNNLPVFEGSEITTGNDGQAEIQFEDGSIARLTPNSTLAISVLRLEGTNTRTEMIMNRGLAYFELQPSDAEHSLQVKFGPQVISSSAFSVIRVEDDVPPGAMAVFTGNVHVELGNEMQLDLHDGESVTFDGADANRYNLAETIQANSWDQWNSDRDQVLIAQSTQRTPATNGLQNYPSDGLSDLNASGSWYDVPGQGYVWSPYDAQAAGNSWDPYGFGNWVYYPRLGYVWVSGYNWGYTPYQCGLWNFYDGFGWGWSAGGGCSPFWGGYGDGFYGGGYGGGGVGGVFLLGAVPPGYHPPRRPVPGPIHPVPRPINGVSTRVAVNRPLAPIVPIDRRPIEVVARSGYRPPPTTAHPLVVAGRTVEPLHPVATRQSYPEPTFGYVNRANPAPLRNTVVVGRPGYVPAPTAPLQSYTGRGYQPAESGRSQGVHSSAPSGGYSGGGASHSSAPSGGGGGGASHSAPAPSPHK